MKKVIFNRVSADSHFITISRIVDEENKVVPFVSLLELLVDGSHRMDYSGRYYIKDQEDEIHGIFAFELEEQ